MEYALTADGGLPEFALLEGAVQALDPAALLDLDATGATLRIATWLPGPSLLQCLAEAGVSSAGTRLRQLPSVCCGGCAS